MKTSSDLLESVRTTITAPANQILLTDDRLLLFANEEVDSKLVPMISSLNQDYFVELEEEDLVSGTAEYDIPYRAIGRALRDLKVSDASGAIKDIVKVALEDAHLNRFESLPLSFYFKGDRIIMVPTPNSSDLTLMKYYMRKPSNIVKVSATGKVTAVSTTTLTLDNVPTTFSGATVDIIQGKQGNRIRTMDATVTNISGSQVTLSAAASDTAIGDYVALSCESPVIQLPDECFPYLSLLTSRRALEALGDYEGAQAFEKELVVRKKNCEYLLAPRIEGEQTKILQRFGLLRGFRGRYVRGVW